jgi:hypothetical protein
MSMDTVSLLAGMSVEVLEAALAKAREREAEREAREVEEAKARWPKCKCGKPVTEIAYPSVTYYFRHVYERRGAAVVSFENVDEQDNAPGSCDIDENVVWGACDDHDCQTNEWTLISTNDLTWG